MASVRPWIRRAAAGGPRSAQQAVLRHVATTGNAPDRSDAHSASAAHGRSTAEVLADLAAEDFPSSITHQARRSSRWESAERCGDT
ncbi:hypothetical protein [Streptomyces sp. P17]|uniref:hypothetical protein n=1 Tax=Streptomyces sp. P17 TaxID=3074716 RepID=UPI0028F43B0C|nr:hypothetical protein [Streptomyces sp. P17]MDT9701276.1 hypothetical protein [Streptomyces sp. P17]